jgi:hypothetical protein
VVAWASCSYEAVAHELATVTGHGERVTRRLGDAAHLDDPLPAADVAVLHRVVCCTDDWRGMVEAALDTEPDVVAITLPHDGLLPETVGRVGNALLRLTRGEYRMRHHAPDAVLGHVTAAGYEVVHDDVGVFWRSVVLQRDSRPGTAEALGQRQ